jgi:hypothetical protein
VHHTDAGSQYTSIAFTERLAAAGVSASVGTVGDAYDNALAESVIGLYKTELIKPSGPWWTAEQVELATLNYVDWFNHRRLYETCGDIPPAELEDAYYRQNQASTRPHSHQTESPDSPGRFSWRLCSPIGQAASDPRAAVRESGRDRGSECCGFGGRRLLRATVRWRWGWSVRAGWRLSAIRRWSGWHAWPMTGAPRSG